MPSLIRVFRRSRRVLASSSVRTVSSRPNSFISARSLALLTFMRSGLSFSCTCTVASEPSASVSGSTSPLSSSSRSIRSASLCSGAAWAALCALRTRAAAGFFAAAVGAALFFRLTGGAAAAPGSVGSAAGLALPAALGLAAVALSFSAAAKAAAGAGAGLLDVRGKLDFIVGMKTSKGFRIAGCRNNTQKEPDARRLMPVRRAGQRSAVRGERRVCKRVGRTCGVQSLRGSSRAVNLRGPGPRSQGSGQCRRCCGRSLQLNNMGLYFFSA